MGIEPTAGVASESGKTGKILALRSKKFSFENSRENQAFCPFLAENHRQHRQILALPSMMSRFSLIIFFFSSKFKLNIRTS